MGRPATTDRTSTSTKIMARYDTLMATLGMHGIKLWRNRSRGFYRCFTMHLERVE